MGIIERATAVRSAMSMAASALDDKTASTAPSFFPAMKFNGELITSGTRICWKGIVKKAAVDLWDTSENTPDVSPDLWEDIQYKDGYRVIPETFTSTLAFSKGELGWWNGVLYESVIEGNVYTPDVYPRGWQKVTE